MSPRVLFFFGLAMLAVAMVNAGCPCVRGVDACSCDSLLVRPPKIPRPIPVPRVICAKLNPPRYGGTDPCCCKPNYVGVPPRPSPRCPSCFKHTDHPAPCSGPVHTIPFSSSDFVPENPEYDDGNSDPHTGVNCGKYSSNAPDPVSLHLAYTAGLNRPANVKEGMLSYGFSKTPQYLPITKETMNIPEEKIAVVDKKILELRPVTSASFDPEEEILAETDDDYGSSDPGAVISYADLGYMPEKGKPCAWKPAPHCHHPHHPHHPHHHHHHHHGSHPGSIVVVSDSTYSDGDPGVMRIDSNEDGYSGSTHVSHHGCGGIGKCAGTCGGTCKACSY